MIISSSGITSTDSRRSLIHYTHKQYIQTHKTQWQQRQRSLLRVDHSVDLSLRLWLHHRMEFGSGAGASHSSYEGDNGETLTVAYLDHEAIWIVEEKLIHLDPSFFNYRPHILYLHLLELLLHCLHTLALHFHNQQVFFINYTTTINILL